MNIYYIQFLHLKLSFVWISIGGIQYLTFSHIIV